jgi:hypothetical protein
MSLITIATAPKPFTNPHIATIQWNAIRSWMNLGSDVDVMVVGDEAGMEQVSKELGVIQVKDVAKNSLGTPLVSSIFNLMRRQSDSPILVYANADILFLPDLVTAVRCLAQQSDKFLGVGRRWDLDIRERLDYAIGWEERLLDDNRIRGRLHAPVGSDYFIFPRVHFADMPDFAIGRAGWDNWMIYEARQRGMQVVDLTSSVTVIHQDHDYSHLPGGQPHYRLPESTENIRRGGGRRTIFNLVDANYRLEKSKIQPVKYTWKKFWREVEIFPLVRMKSRFFSEVFFTLFHPVKALKEWRGWLLYKIKNIPPWLRK